MADNEQKQANDQPVQQQPQQVVMLDPVAQTQQAIAQAAREAEEKQLDEALDYPAKQNADGTLIAGGRYKVGGQYVNAEGVPLKNQKD